MKFEMQNISGGYGKNLILEDISIHINAGEIIAVLGPNGCGKSTLLKIAGRLQKPFSGNILLNGKEIHTIPGKKLAQQIAILTQSAEISSGMTVKELVSLGRYPYRDSAAEREKHVQSALEITEISNLQNRFLSSLSGGERQRARLAMTLAQSPELLLLDEPTTFLDVKCQFEILGLIKRLNNERKISVLMVLHDLSLAAMYSDRLLLLKDKKIRYSGTPQEVMKPEIIRDIFGIETQIIQHNGHPLCLATGKNN